MHLPRDIVYQALVNLSKEAREKLERIKPETLGQASRIAGVSRRHFSTYGLFKIIRQKVLIRETFLQKIPQK